MKKELNEVITPELKKIGFGEIKYKGGNWIYERTVGECLQQIIIYKERFNKNTFRYQLLVDAGKYGKRSNLLSVLFSEDEGTEDGFWKYDGTSEDLKRSLNDMLTVILTKGLSELEQLSVIKTDNSRSKRYHRLYEEHERLNAQFIQRKAPIVDKFDEESIENWIGLMQEDVDAKKDEDEIDQCAFEAASFLSHQIIKFIGVKWHHEKEGEDEDLYLEDFPATFVRYDFLGRIRGAFRENKLFRIQGDLEDMLEIYRTKM